MGGAGGDGACCFHSEPRKEFGGPDGGDGGNGGHVIIKGDLLSGGKTEAGAPALCITVKNLFIEEIKQLSITNSTWYKAYQYPQ